MTGYNRVKEAAQDVLESLQRGKAGGVLPGASLDEAWAELEDNIANAIKPHLDNAYAAGQADGLRKAKGEK